MTRLSRKFSAPKASDLQQREKVRYLVENGFLFYSVQEMIAPNASKRAQYPRTLAEAKLFVERLRSQSTRPQPMPNPVLQRTASPPAER